MNTDLTVGKPWKALLFYILPLFGSAVFQQLYTLADTVIAGKFAQPTALTAIGASNSIVNILMAIALGANAGCAVLASRFFGSKNNAKIKSTVSTALIAFASLSAVFAFSTFFFAEPLVRLFMPEGEADALALSSGAQFIRIAAFFFFAVNVKVVADGTVRGCNGNVGFMVSTFTDLILRVAFVFILTPLLGFAGVGWAWAVGWSLGTCVALGFYLTIPCLRKKNMSLYDEEGNLLALPASAADPGSDGISEKTEHLG